MTFSWWSHLPARDICAPRASFTEAYSNWSRFMYKHNSGNAGIHGKLIICELWSHASNTGSSWEFLTFVLPELRFVYHLNTICINYYRHWLPFCTQSYFHSLQKLLRTHVAVCYTTRLRNAAFLPTVEWHSSVRTNAEWLPHSHSIRLIMKCNGVDDEISSMKM